jgi:adhesin transport system membrane fusion protein
MLNISDNTVSHRIRQEDYTSFRQTGESTTHRQFTRWLLAVLGLVILLLLLPWTQNIQSKGKVTTLRPEQRPQIIPSPIDARIDQWYVREGQLVKKGDTIVFISEIKADYLDPDLVSRTQGQVTAKEGAIASYQDKVGALEDQITNMEAQLTLKQQQLQRKIEQGRFKIAADSADLAQAIIQDSIAIVQFERAKTLFARGIDSRAKMEEKQAKLQETRNKVIAAENKLNTSRAELRITTVDRSAVQAEYSEKIAKARSDIASTLSQRFDAEGDVNKLRIQTSNYTKRSSFHYITAPQDCYITKTVTPGIGETIKEGDGIVSIMPAHYELAVELYIDPMDFPLVNMDTSLGKKPQVRFIFDGWPAFIFSGWPGQSFGTYVGEIMAIDNEISINGKYRILVSPTPGTKTWPKELRVGSGAQGIILLNNVPLWYEIWRKLNGFPPDYYKTEAAPREDIKQKTPAQLIK